MINDASENINPKKVDNKNEKTCTMQRRGKKLTGNKDVNDEFDGECDGDFPMKPATFTVATNDDADDDDDSRNIALTADASKMRSTKTTTSTTKTKAKTKSVETTTANWCHLENKGEPAKPTTSTTAKATTTITSRQLTTINRKKISPTTTKRTANTSAIITTSTKSPPTHTKRTEEKSRTKTSPTLRKNKCPASERHEISSQIASKATTPKIQTALYGRIRSAETTTTPTTTTTPKAKNTQCKSLESIGSKQSLPGKEKLASPSPTPTLSLAEQKAELRSAFFKDIRPEQSELSGLYDRGNQIRSIPITKEHQIPKRLSRKNSKQKQKTLPTVRPDSGSELGIDDFSEDQQTVLVPIIHTKGGGKLSLIDQRKLELAQKFSTQTTVRHTRNRESPLIEFRRVAQLVKKFDRMIVNPQNKDGMEYTTADQTMLTLKPDAQDPRHNSPLSDEGCNLGQSPYSTDDEQDNDDNVSIRTSSTMIETSRSSRHKDKVARSASSDSALGLDVDDPMDASNTGPMTPPNEQQQQKRRMTLTVTDLPLRPALLPLAEPTTLPDSPTPDIQQTLQNLLAQTTVPSKVLLEERVVEIPEEPVFRPVCPPANVASRRESEQSSISSDYPLSEPGGGNMPGVRYVRTPSVVVSDYSDDVMCGITLEEIEYFRAQRLRRRSSLDATGIDSGDSHSDVSASSSCSNLNYCGSTISTLDGAECFVNGRRVQLHRKISNCSTGSTSGNEDDSTSTSSSAFTLTEDGCSRDLSDLLAAQHLCSKRAKKVGAPTPESKGLPTSLNIVDKEVAESPYLK